MKGFGLLTLGICWSALALAQPPATEAFKFDEFLLAPLRVHLLTATNSPSIHTTLAETDVTRILGKVNGIWAQAGLHFYLESLAREAAATPETDTAPLTFRDQAVFAKLRPVTSQAPAVFHVYYLKAMTHNGIYYPEGLFVKETASLRQVEGGIDEPIPRVTAHELGHALTLLHRQDHTNLMASGTTGTRLNAGEIAQARAAARDLVWIETAPVVLRRAEVARRAGNKTEARAWYARLAALPLKSRQVESARRRWQELKP